MSIIKHHIHYNSIGENMTNIINSQNLNINNNISAQNISMGRKNDDFVKAPDYLPTYTADSLLKEKDEFRKQITSNQYMSLIPKAKKKHTKLKIFFAALAGLAILALKKKK